MQTNLLLEVVRLSFSLSGRFISPYGQIKSPHKFTQLQLMTCLVLRAYSKTTYRGVIDLLAANQSVAMRTSQDRLTSIEYAFHLKLTAPGKPRISEEDAF